MASKTTKPTTPTNRPRPGEMVIDIALHEGTQLARRAIHKQLSKVGVSSLDPATIEAGQSFSRQLIASAIARLASRSVPGTMVVGAGLLAKGLYERRRIRREREKAEQQAAAEAEADGKAVE